MQNDFFSLRVEGIYIFHALKPTTMKYTTVSPANCDFTPRLLTRGKWRIKCDIRVNDRKGSFYCTISDSEFIDKINQMSKDQEPYDFKQAAWFERIFPLIEKDVNEWMEDHV